MEFWNMLAGSVSSLTSEAAAIHAALQTMRDEVAAETRRTKDLLAASAARAADRAGIAAIPSARLLSDSIALEGSAAERLGIRRHYVGEVAERTFRRWMGVTQCVSEDAEVRALWEWLLEQEAACDDLLRGLPSTVLDVPGATVSMAAHRRLRVVLDGGTGPAGEQNPPQTVDPERVLAVPRFTYDLPRAKLDNFGHWLIDCAPHVLALSTIDSRARYLLPAPVKEFQRAVLALIGVGEHQIVEWDGGPVRAERLLVMERDGRIGGGRPLSPLSELRRVVSPPAEAGREGRTRRIYISRRDAAAKGSWLSNEPDVEDVFRSRGFEILVMSECPLADQVRLFQEAAVVAGVNGAGLSDIVFSAPHAHVAVLVSDSLVRWYAAPGRGRAKWADRGPGKKKHLADFSDSPHFYAHLAAACEQYFHYFVSPDRVPARELAAFVDEVLVAAVRS